MILPGTDVRLTGLWFPGSSLLCFMKMKGHVSPFQSVGTSADCHSFLYMIDSGYEIRGD